MALALGLALVASLSAAAPTSVLVFVPLCDGDALACGKGGLGDPSAPDTNLYWGARYGAERFLRGQPGYVVTTTASPGAGEPWLRKVVLTRRVATEESAVTVTLLAWDGRRIDDALADFLVAVAEHRADLVVWAGHDRLMDVAAPAVARTERDPASVAVLACESERWFSPVIDRLGARSVALTRTFMAPEGYLIDALVTSVARHGPDERRHLRAALVDAYARYQKVSKRAAGTVFSRLE